MRQGPESTLTPNRMQTTTPQIWIMSPESNGIDSEASMLSGISRKRNLCSSPDWFAKFAIHNAYHGSLRPFIVVRAETSIAESCCERQNWETNSGRSIRQEARTRKWSDDRSREELTSTHPALPPLSFCARVSMQIPSTHRTSRPEFTAV